MKDEKIEVEIFIENILEGFLYPTKKMLYNKIDEKNCLAHLLAIGGYIFYDTEILLLENTVGETVAYLQALVSDNTGWTTNDRKILLMANSLSKITVAEVLAVFSPYWTTSDPNILKIKCTDNLTIKERLIYKKKLIE